MAAAHFNVCAIVSAYTTVALYYGPLCVAYAEIRGVRLETWPVPIEELLR